jgi:hypothetical protein
VYPHIVFVDAHYGSRAHDQQQQHEVSGASGLHQAARASAAMHTMAAAHDQQQQQCAVCTVGCPAKQNTVLIHGRLGQCSPSQLHAHPEAHQCELMVDQQAAYNGGGSCNALQ